MVESKNKKKSKNGFKDSELTGNADGKHTASAIP